MTHPVRIDAIPPPKSPSTLTTRTPIQTRAEQFANDYKNQIHYISAGFIFNEVLKRFRANEILDRGGNLENCEIQSIKAEFGNEITEKLLGWLPKYRANKKKTRLEISQTLEVSKLKSKSESHPGNIAQPVEVSRLMPSSESRPIGQPPKKKPSSRQNVSTKSQTSGTNQKIKNSSSQQRATKKAKKTELKLAMKEFEGSLVAFVDEATLTEDKKDVLDQRYEETILSVVGIGRMKPTSLKAMAGQLKFLVSWKSWSKDLNSFQTRKDIEKLDGYDVNRHGDVVIC